MNAAQLVFRVDERSRTKRRWPSLLSVLLFASAVAVADPIDAVEDGAYLHHDSGFVFAATIGEFALVGTPQDVAGSREAIAYYARGVETQRTVVSVDVIPADSSASSDSGEPFDLGENGLTAKRLVSAKPAINLSTVSYFISKGDWRVLIEVSLPAGDSKSLTSIDAFVRGQRWASLASR